MRARLLAPALVAAALALTASVANASPASPSYKRIVANQSSRNGAVPELIVLHTTTDPNSTSPPVTRNRPGIKDLKRLGAYFNRPQTAVSSHVANDAEGNDARYVSDRRRAWTEVAFNAVGLSIEQIATSGFTRSYWMANRRPQLEDTARWIAHWHRRWGIPIRRAEVSGGRVIRSGVTTHAALGAAGGGHDDPGPGYPFGYVIRLARSLADGPPRAVAASTHPKRRVVLLGLRQRGDLARFARQVSNPASDRYRRFLTVGELRQRFSARPADRQRVLRYLRPRQGVKKVELSSTETVALAVMTPAAARRSFCVSGPAPPTRGLCIPRQLRPAVRQVSVGESYETGWVGGAPARALASGRASAAQGSPRGCAAALETGGFTPNQLSTAYGLDPLHARGLNGHGVRVVTLAGQTPSHIGLETWARCFGLPKPRVRSIAMPGGNDSTATPDTEEALDIEALASLAPRLARITPIFVPLDQGFGNSFPLFMFGVLSPKRQGGELPDILSISDGICEGRFTRDQLRLGQRMLREASALGITALSASGDSGFLGCEAGGRGASFPNTSRFVAGVGGTDLTLDAQNQISNQVVWSTFATAGKQGAGTGGGPSDVFGRPSFQRAPGIGPALQAGHPTRLGPDVAAMASFEPGIATFDEGQGGWGTDGGTSAATPLTAAMVALVRQQESDAGRPALGSLPPLLYKLARGPSYHAIFDDITTGTSSRKPSSPAAARPSGGAAQPGYDLATGLGSLDAAAFAAAVAGTAPASGGG